MVDLRVVRESFPEQTAVDARPSIIQIGAVPVTVIRGNDSGTLRLIAYRPSDDGQKLLRKAHSAPMGRIKGTPAACRLPGERLVTASHGENSNRLFLIFWQMLRGPDLSLTFERLGDSGSLIGTPGGSSDLAWLGTKQLFVNRVAVAVSTKNSNLKLISFDISAVGAFNRMHDSGGQAGKITSPPVIAHVGQGGNVISSQAPEIAVTAFRSSSGRLKLISWAIDEDGIRRKSDTGNGGLEMVGRPAIVRFMEPAIRQPVAVVTRHNDHYHLSTFSFDRDGRILEGPRVRSGASVAGSPAIAALERRLVVAMRTEPGGGLLVESFLVDFIDDAFVFGKESTETAGDIGAVGSPSICPPNVGFIQYDPRFDGFFTAIRNQDQRLAVHQWGHPFP